MLSAMEEVDDLEPETITIRCPGCSQRFRISPNLAGKMVECGSCDDRFRVTEEVIVRTRKFYPGEHWDASLQRFSRVPIKSVPNPDFEAAPQLAEPASSAREIQTFSPFKLMLGIVAVLLVVLAGLLLMAGGHPGGPLDGAGLGRRLILAAFTGAIAIVLLVLANPGAKLKGFIGGIVCLMLLLVLPLVFTEGRPDAPPDAPPPVVQDPSPDDDNPVAGGLEALKEEMRYGKMALAIEEYGPDGVRDGRTAVGVWLRDVREFSKDLIVKYLISSSGADDRSWAYPRPPSDYLVILHGVDPDLSKVERIAQRFGIVGRVVEELQVIEVKVDNERFEAGPSDKLSDPENPSFYQLNLRELESIDASRAGQAVKRLISVEPKTLRGDIVSRLEQLMIRADVGLRDDIARALAAWAEPDDGSVEVVREALSKTLAENEEVPRSVVEFVVSRKDEGSLQLLHRLWAGQPGDWEALYGDMGSGIEPDVLGHLGDADLNLVASSIRLLGRVGTSRSLPALRAARGKAHGELASLLSQSIEAIEKRE
jgi:hypothetical protein